MCVRERRRWREVTVRCCTQILLPPLSCLEVVGTSRYEHTAKGLVRVKPLPSLLPASPQAAQLSNFVFCSLSSTLDSFQSVSLSLLMCTPQCVYVQVSVSTPLSARRPLKIIGVNRNTNPKPLKSQAYKLKHGPMP